MDMFSYKKSDTYLGFIITFKGVDYCRWPQHEAQVRFQVNLLNEAYQLGLEHASV